MVTIFKTNVKRPAQAARILSLLQSRFPNIGINFDLDDCDKILRFEGADIDFEDIIQILTANGYQCCLLD
jgi:hypothetical protein